MEKYPTLKEKGLLPIKEEYPFEEDKPKPLNHGWLPLSDGKGIKWTLWKTNLVLQRQEKHFDKWLVTEEIHLSPKILKEVYWRIPNFLETISK